MWESQVETECCVFQAHHQFNALFVSLSMHICGSHRQKSNIIALRISITLLHLKHYNTELLLWMELIYYVLCKFMNT